MGELSQTAILVDDSGVQDRVQAARRQHSIVSAQLPEEEQEDSRRCEDARDEVIQWIAENKPQTTAEERRVTEHMARVATKLLSELGHKDQTCTREGWEQGAKVCNEVLVPLAIRLGEERGQRLWDSCVQPHAFVRVCFQGIGATGCSEAIAMLRTAGVETTASEWTRATCCIRRRRGVAPPTAAVTMVVQPNENLRQILRGRQQVGPGPVATQVVRSEDQLANYSTLVRDTRESASNLRTWTKVCSLMGVSEVHMREILLLCVMLEHPSFQPLDMLVGSPENPCLLSEAWDTRGNSSEPIRITGNESPITLDNAFAVQEAWSIDGKTAFEARKATGAHDCFHRGARLNKPSLSISVGLTVTHSHVLSYTQARGSEPDEDTQLVDRWCQEAPDWWSLCKVRMRWETPATGSQRERESAVCVRVIQHTKGTADQTQVAEVKEIEKTLLGFANAIVDQCFSEAPKYNPCDIRYQGFTDQTGKGRGMVTISRRSQDTFNTDVAVGCILGFYMGNGISAGKGRAHKWCPFLRRWGITSAKITSITRACDYHTKHRTPVRFGSQRTGG